MLYIVSGLPRSGTSMLMRMLEAGGIEVLTDNRRQADDDNPKGYYEYEPVKKLAEDATWIKDVDDKGLKIISHLLRYLPSDRFYRILFMLRPIEEILLSQQKMLENQGQPFDDKGRESLYRKFSDHLYAIRLWIARQSNIDCLFINYSDIIHAPLESAMKIGAFLGVDTNPESMASVVDKKLYRNRIQ